MEKLSQDQIQKELSNLTGWKLDNDAIRRDWEFRDFSEALIFINRVGSLVEKHDHHPEIFNVYNKVTLRFNTHSAGGITTKDFNIARDIDAV
ncbi:MAG TPA: 4a-hydroxytetrahydrobiopterin dehydratase [Caldithrix sp.]|nr:4a-hydroxytetrahydrobiopterin dehydratase [Calditrichaceae bacterium]HEM49503.1 4a-hydroxytetrahydrobiopterin dehydratase [Caldithrix sp.]